MDLGSGIPLAVAIAGFFGSTITAIIKLSNRKNGNPGKICPIHDSLMDRIERIEDKVDKIYDLVLKGSK